MSPSDYRGDAGVAELSLALWHSDVPHNLPPSTNVPPVPRLFPSGYALVLLM